MFLWPYECVNVMEVLKFKKVIIYNLFILLF